MKPWKELWWEKILIEDEKIKTRCNEIEHICLRRISCRYRASSVRTKAFLSCSVNRRSKNTLTEPMHMENLNLLWLAVDSRLLCPTTSSIMPCWGMYKGAEYYYAKPLVMGRFEKSVPDHNSTADASHPIARDWRKLEEEDGDAEEDSKNMAVVPKKPRVISEEVLACCQGFGSRKGYAEENYAAHECPRADD